LRIFPTPLSFNALAWSEPFQISSSTAQLFIAKTIRRCEDCVILACVVLRQCHRVTDRQTSQTDRHHRQADIRTVAI